VLQSEVRAIDGRLAVAEAGWREAAARAAQAAAKGGPSPAADADVRTVADDLKRLRDDLHGELVVVDARLADLRRRIDEAGAAPAAATAVRDAAPSPEDEDRWITRARDSDPGVRFSALSRLGRVRTDRAVQVSVERLADDDVEVVWQAVRNLGQFRERDAAAQVAALLDHAEAVVRAAAHDALVAMGAPKDVGFDATAPAEKRKPAADKLKHWAETP
jgi:HEAT repeat protein